MSKITWSIKAIYFGGHGSRNEAGQGMKQIRRVLDQGCKTLQ